MTFFYESFLASYHALRIDSDRIAVAVSGGVDSMTLLFLLLQIREKKISHRTSLRSHASG